MYFLFANPQKPETIRAAQEVAAILLGAGDRVVLDDWLYDLLRVGERGNLNSLLRGDTEAILSFGGDGTLLRTLPTAARAGIPVLGVNMGRVGFLLETDRADVHKAIESLRSRRYTLEKRNMLSAHVNGESEEFLVMNDVVLCRGGNPSSIAVDAYANDELVYTTHGDGIIVATATGSTGYCLSAGGPVLHPSLRNIVLLPICTHKAQQLPIVFEEDVRVRLRCQSLPGRTQQVIFDGQEIIEMQGLTEVFVERASYSAQFIRFEPQHFFTRLRLKQAEWSGK